MRQEDARWLAARSQRKAVIPQHAVALEALCELMQRTQVREHLHRSRSHAERGVKKAGKWAAVRWSPCALVVLSVCGRLSRPACARESVPVHCRLRIGATGQLHQRRGQEQRARLALERRQMTAADSASNKHQSPL